MAERLDKVLLQRGLVPTRSRARDLIARGCVLVDGIAYAKAGTLVSETADLRVTEDVSYVSRGALKLEAALDAFGLDSTGRIALDVGASTGGFTEVLLRRGAAQVYAVDVGHGQLHARLAADPRVINCEGLDAREISAVTVPPLVGVIVADVSFISLDKVLPAALARAAAGAWLAALIKPQFEAGRAAIGKGGIVRDGAVRDAQAAKVSEWMAAQGGWRVLGVIPSPIEGGSGNQEFLIGAVRDE